MTLDRVRAICLKFPHATEQIQWQDDLVFKVGGKMFAVARLTVPDKAAVGNALAFKCTPEQFAALLEYEDIVPAPYLARAYWVSLARFDVLNTPELSRRLRESYDLVFAGLAKSARNALGASQAPKS
jgi:predicted DNA-binding protein (MmcQ/YjbR family)